MLRMMLMMGMVICSLLSPAFAGESAKPGAAAAVTPEKTAAETSREMLQSIVDLKKTLVRRMEEKNRQLNAATSETEKADLKQELAALDRQLDNATGDLERIATGIDIDLFREKEVQPFNWQDELLSLVEPGIKELKRFTAKARQKARLKEDIQQYETLLPIARQALESIRDRMARNPEKMIKNELAALEPEWKGVVEQLDSRLKVARMRLNKMTETEQSLVELSRTSMREFFRTRGLYLGLAVLTCCVVLLLLRFAYRVTLQIMPGFRSGDRPFYARLVDLIFKVMAVVLSLVALVLVFYLAEDWVLLSISLIVLLGLGWGVKSTLPDLWRQGRLMLNIGAVREGERMVMDGVPWRVNRINMFSELENPDLGIKLRLPIEYLMGKTSRAFRKGECWFPCRREDWVILSDGTRGKVVSLSHEMVELVQRGGARKIYQTGDFLSQTPLNISVNFRLKVVFGIGYDHQKEVTGSVLQTVHDHIENALTAEGYADHNLNLKVEFCQAGASSLDFVVIADFDGELAPLYNRLNRAIQRWCVDVCTLNGWNIPFPQITVHQEA